MICATVTPLLLTYFRFLGLQIVRRSERFSGGDVSERVIKAKSNIELSSGFRHESIRRSLQLGTRNGRAEICAAPTIVESATKACCTAPHVRNRSRVKTTPITSIGPRVIRHSEWTTSRLGASHRAKNGPNCLYRSRRTSHTRGGLLCLPETYQVNHQRRP